MSESSGHVAHTRAEPLFERRARVQRRLEQQRTQLALAWRALEERAYVQERRIVGFTRGFRAVLPLGAVAGAVWLLRRYGPARVARPVIFGLSAWRFARRALPFGFNRQKDRNGSPAARLPIAVAIARAVGRRKFTSHERRSNPA